ncbi:MAG: hypothetical protein ACOC31_02735 [Bacteroidota bacterium]
MKVNGYITLLGLFVFLLVTPGCFMSGKSRQARQKERLTIRSERDQKRNFDRARNKELKHRFEIQTKDTQKRMKKSRKEAQRFNDSFSHRKGFFNIFKRKKR